MRCYLLRQYIQSILVIMVSPQRINVRLDELLDLFKTMVYDIEKVNPTLDIMEIADGILQRETKMIIDSPLFRRSVNKCNSSSR